VVDREAPALRRRDEVREIASGSLLAIVVIVAWSIVAPVRIEIVDPFQRDWGEVLPSLLFGIALMAGLVGWILLVERRRPWPMAPPAGRTSWFVWIVFVLAVTFTSAWARQNWPPELYLPNPADPPSPVVTVQTEDGDVSEGSYVETVLRVSIPENEARGLILATLVAWIASTCAWLLVRLGRSLRRRRPKPLDASSTA
jgi:hypothetical protein